MYPEHEPLHTSRPDDKILSLLGHTLSLKKFFSFFYYFLSAFYSTLLWRRSLEHTALKYCQCSWNHKPLSVHYSLGMSRSLWRLLQLRRAPHFCCLPHGSPGYGWSSEGITPLSWTAAQPASHFLWCNADTWKSFSTPRSRMLNLSGLTALVSGSYLNVTLTWSYITVNVIKILNYKFQNRQKSSQRLLKMERKGEENHSAWHFSGLYSFPGH